MFEDSLIESGGKLKTSRGWTSIVSFILQVMIVGVMILILLHPTSSTQALFGLVLVLIGIPVYFLWRKVEGNRPPPPAVAPDAAL